MSVPKKKGGNRKYVEIASSFKENEIESAKEKPRIADKTDPGSPSRNVTAIVRNEKGVFPGTGPDNTLITGFLFDRFGLF